MVLSHDRIFHALRNIKADARLHLLYLMEKIFVLRLINPVNQLLCLGSEEPEIVVDVYFQNTRTIYRDMPLITEKLGLDADAASYHELLLSRYLIHDPQDAEPPLLMAFYLVILIIMSLALVLIIHNSFAVTMNARIHQFGIFSSIGATPGQIRTCLMQEAAALCAVPILVGSIIGITPHQNTQ